MKKNQSASVPVLPVLPRSASRRGGSGTCLCGCPGTTGGRFVPGHDSKLLAWVLHVERGTVTLDATGLHKESVQVEMALRAAAGLTGKGHTKALITSADLTNGVKTVKARKASKPRARKVAAEVAAETAATEAVV